MESYDKDTLTLKISTHSKWLSKSYAGSKLHPPLNIQLSITSSSKLQISIVMTFWRAMIMIYKLFKFQIKTKNTTKIMACQNLYLSMDGLGFSKFQTFITFAIQLQIQLVNSFHKALNTMNNLPKFLFQKISSQFP